MGSWIVRSVCLRYSVIRTLILSFLLFWSFLDPLSPESHLSKPDLR
jgi:hypothetical protein